MVRNALSAFNDEDIDHQTRVSDQRDVMKVLSISQQLLRQFSDASDSKAQEIHSYDMLTAIRMAHKLLLTLPDASVLEILGSKLARETGSYFKISFQMTDRLASSTGAEFAIIESFLQVWLDAPLSHQTATGSACEASTIVWYLDLLQNQKYSYLEISASKLNCAAACSKSCKQST